MKSVVDPVRLAPDPGYTVEVQAMSEAGWTGVLERFGDALLMQTWPYGARRWGATNLSHLVMRYDGRVAAAAQVVVMKVPVLGRGIAYVKWGPLWHPRGGARDWHTFRMIVRSLRETFAVRDGLVVRIFPNAVQDGPGEFHRIFEEEGFTRNHDGSPKTVRIDLSHSIDDLFKSLAGKWRSRLRLSETNGLQVIEGNGDEMFTAFLGLYKEMQARKKRHEIFDIDEYAAIQRDLPAALKMRVMLCAHAGEPIAGIVLSCCDDTALLLFAATGQKALQLRGSYFLFWDAVRRLKAAGYRWFDLHGINHVTSPGPSEFKTRLAGRLGRHADYVGQFEACENKTSWYAVRFAARALEARRRMRVRISEWLRPATDHSGES